MRDKNLPSGSGIVIEDSDRVVVEHSVAHHNGRFNPATDSGPVGFLNANSNAVTLQFNESYANSSGNGSKDGSGLDLDGGMTNSVMQYNYSHDNAGPGLQTAQYDLARDNWGGNVIRYNVSQNDARKNAYGGLHIAGGAELRNLEVYHNTLYMSPGSSGDTAAARVKSVGTGVRVRNNLFYTTGGVRLADLDSNAADFEGNGYWAGGSSFKLEAGGATYTSLGAWRSATGQERNGTTSTGVFADPKLAAAGLGGTINSPGSLHTLSAYRLQSGSPMIDAGVSLSGGPRDFYGTSLPQGGGPDIGAAEWTSSTTTPTPTPTPAPTPPPIVSGADIAVGRAGAAADYVNGQTTPVDFGFAAPGATPPLVTFRVANTGGSPLTLGAVKLPAGFSLVEGLSVQLNAGASDTFTVRMDTATAGVRTGFVSIPSSDPDENSFTFAVSGMVGTPPEQGAPLSLRAAADAYVRDGATYANTNFGASAKLQLKRAGAGWYRESFLRFDLSKVGSVSSAKLRLFGKLDNTRSASVGFQVYGSADTTWNESAMTFNNRPAASGAPVAAGRVTGTSGKWYEVDLTAFLRQQKAAGATAVTLVIRASDVSNSTVVFDRDAGTNRPELVVAS
jgi:hypothetical protein